MTRQLGTITEIWRYPVSSVAGERLDMAAIGTGGIAHDRAWCLLDGASGQPAQPEKDRRWRPALFLAARLARDGRPELGFPDGEWLGPADVKLPERLLAHFGFAVGLHPYGRGVANRYVPSPLHIVTTASLAHLSALTGAPDIDGRRFRPNIVLQNDGAASFAEKTWIGKSLDLGQARIRADEETQRCGMTLAAQPGLSENPDILRAILRHNRRNFGIYCSVETAGTIRLGDSAAG